jgi:hypothetical protein
LAFTLTPTLLPPQAARMTSDIPPGFEQVARDVAARIAGPGMIQDVRVAAELGPFDEVVYVFLFLVDPERDRPRLGQVRGDLLIGLRDALIERGDWTTPTIRFMTRADWDRVHA